jgi:hypothetical protein
VKYFKISHGIMNDGTFKRQTLFPLTILSFDFERLTFVPNVDELISALDEMED